MGAILAGFILQSGINPIALSVERTLVGAQYLLIAGFSFHLLRRRKYLS